MALSEAQKLELLRAKRLFDQARQVIMEKVTFGGIPFLERRW